MDQDGAGAIRQDIRDLRADLTQRLDSMITRREHEAEVRRIDSEHRALAASHEALAQTADVEHAELRNALSADKKERLMERARIEDARRADRRTYLQITIAAIGIFASIVIGAISIIAP
ncbi:hypothetical protein [Actinotalea sp.]|uniref:hypothetical protein n=1 Tax=Actinotalea sp. TaxID=1872145 RepID=UPI003564E1A0